MIYRLLLNLTRLINTNLKYKFAYWWVCVFSYLNRFNPVLHSLPSCPVKTMDLNFPNPVGLAAGFDRDGKLARDLVSTGFGFVEIGTINVNSEKDSDNELINIVRNLQRPGSQSADQPLLGISLGSLRDTLDEQTVADYLMGMKTLWQYSDYLVINLSRPGSSTRSAGSNKNAFSDLLEKIKQGHSDFVSRYGNRVPIIIKVAIDYQDRETLPDTLTIARELGFDGVLAAFEHWPSRDDVIVSVHEISASIQPLPLIAVGGIQTVDDVCKILEAGASLVQLYHGLVLQGPLQIRRMISQLSKNESLCKNQD
jgi:dihydroorotate dehydrogenase